VVAFSRCGDPRLSWPARPSASSGAATRSSASRWHVCRRRTDLGLHLRLHLQADAQEGGAFSKDPIPETCVTIYVTSELDSCVDASMDLAAVTSYVVTMASYVDWRRAQGGFGGGGLVHGSSGGNEGSATPR
jgi:hypothetical protein